MNSMMNSDDTIDSLQLEGEILIVNVGGIEKIVAYGENGEMAPVVWFAIYNRGRIISRINSKYVAKVNYKQEA